VAAVVPTGQSKILQLLMILQQLSLLTVAGFLKILSGVAMVYF